MLVRELHWKKIVGQLFVATMTVRGVACAYSQKFVMAEGANANAKDCEKACVALMQHASGCGVAVKVNSCEVVYTPEDGGAGDTPLFLCDMEMNPSRCGAGRRPAGFEEMDGPPLAQMARLEAAAVQAFVDLAVELGVHGAPTHLVRAAVRAATDEVVHANVIGRLARAAGHAPLPFEMTEGCVRDLAAVAEANAVEGCVREDEGARVLARLARRSERHRAVLGPIARDEARHARLSRAVHDWARPLLAPSDQRRVARAMSEARHLVDGSRDPSERVI